MGATFLLRIMCMRHSRKVTWDMVNYFCYFPLALTNISPSRDRLRAVSLFSVVRRAKRETRKWPRAWLMARDGRGTPPSFRASRGFAASARVHCSHQVWRKREAARSLLPWHSFKFLFFEEQLTHNHPQYLSGLSRSCMWTKIGY